MAHRTGFLVLSAVQDADIGDAGGCSAAPPAAAAAISGIWHKDRTLVELVQQCVSIPPYRVLEDAIAGGRHGLFATAAERNAACSTAFPTLAESDDSQCSLLVIQTRYVALLVACGKLANRDAEVVVA